MTRPRPLATCAVCDHPEASPREGHRFALCRTCEAAWERSPEHARAATARADFVDRMRAELGAEQR
jgi:hypothetical protein